MRLPRKSLLDLCVLASFGSILSLVLFVNMAPSATLAPDLQKFVGTWQGQFKGKTFMTIKLGEQGAKLSGTVIHTTNIDFDDKWQHLGRRYNEHRRSSDRSTHDGRQAHLKITDNGDQGNPVQCELALTGKDKGIFRMVVAPPKQLKPWNVERISNASR